MLYSSSVRMSKLDFECQNKIFMANSIVSQNRFSKSKYNIRPQFQSQSRILNVKYDFQHQIECKNRILKAKIRYSALEIEF